MDEGEGVKTTGFSSDLLISADHRKFKHEKTPHIYDVTEMMHVMSKSHVEQLGRLVKQCSSVPS